MRLKTCLLYLVAFLVFSACKNNSKNNGNKIENAARTEEIDLEDRLIVTMNALVPNDDNFEIYYRKKEEKFQPENKVSLKINGTEKVQELVFVLDVIEFPSYLRIDFGRNPNQNNLRLESLSISFNENSHEFTIEELKKFFHPNKNMKVDFESGEIVLQKTGDKYNPYLNSNNIAHFFNKLYLY